MTQRTSLGRSIVMIGTGLKTKGGISAVVNTYRRTGLFDEWPIIYLSSHTDGRPIQKLWAAVVALVSFSGLLLTRRVAIVHVHSASDASFWRKCVFIILARLAGRPVIFHLHGGGFWDFYLRLGSALKAVVRRILDSAVYVIVLSESWSETIKRISPDAKTVVIHNPVEKTEEQSPTRASQKHTGPLVFVGRIVHEKGVFDLLEAFASIHGQFPALELVVAGEGDTVELQGRAEVLEIADVVHCVGWIGGEEKKRLLRNAVALVLPSHVEGLPMVLLEAMAAGLPIIATRVGAIPEAVTNEREGVLIEPHDIGALAEAMKMLVSNPGYCRRLGEAGRERVRKSFDARLVLAKIADLYTSLGMFRISHE